MNPAAIYSYRRADGREFFQRVRFEDPVFDRGVLLGYTKEVKYRFRCDPRSRCLCADTDWGWHWKKPDGADGYLYRLPEVVAAIDAGKTVWVDEGEKDADRMAAAGVCSTSHHQGAEVGPNRMQAARLVSARHIKVVMDRDEAGAFCAWRWHELLRSVGVSAGRITVVRACGPVDAIKDAYDHLEAGHGVGDFVTVDKGRVRDVALGHLAKRRARPRRAYWPGRRWGGE